MEPESSLPQSQVPATCPYPEPVRSTSTSHFLKIHLNIILPSVPGSPKWSIQLYSKENWNIYQHCRTSSRTILQSDHEQWNVNPQNSLSFSNKSYLIRAIRSLCNLWRSILQGCHYYRPYNVDNKVPGEWWTECDLESGCIIPKIPTAGIYNLFRQRDTKYMFDWLVELRNEKPQWVVRLTAQIIA